MVRKCELLIIRLLLVFRPLQDDLTINHVILLASNFDRLWQICSNLLQIS